MLKNIIQVKLSKIDASASNFRQLDSNHPLKSEKHSWMSASLTKLLSFTPQKFSEAIISILNLKTKQKGKQLQIILNKPQTQSRCK